MDRAKKPNILVIMADQHGAWASGAYGHPFIQTPHLDRLAQTGVTFESAYCNSPICGPSRASFLTGRAPHGIEAWDNGKPLASDVPTWAHYLTTAGYQTVLAGKQHFIGPDQQHGFELRLGGELHSTRIQEGTINPFEPIDTTKYFHTGVGRTRYTEYDYDIEARACSFLSGDERDKSRPFALCVSFIAPHFPLVVEDEYMQMYLPHHADLPQMPPGYPERLHPVWQAHRRYYNANFMDAEKTRRARAAYYALCTFMDRRVGNVLKALEQAGEADNTLIVYTADHGEHIGSRGMWWKSSFFEESVRVPLIISWPGHLPQGARRPEVVSLVDVAATLLDVGGVDAAGDMDGRPLSGLLRGEGGDWTDQAFSEYYASGADEPRCMLRLGRYKLNWFVGHSPELYDLETDPGEWRNLADDPDHASVVADLSGRIQAMWDGQDIAWRVEVSKRRRRLILQAESTYLGPPAPPAQ